MAASIHNEGLGVCPLTGAKDMEFTTIYVAESACLNSPDWSKVMSFLRLVQIIYWFPFEFILFFLLMDRVSS